MVDPKLKTSQAAVVEKPKTGGATDPKAAPVGTKEPLSNTTKPRNRDSVKITDDKTDLSKKGAEIKPTISKGEAKTEVS